jgi:hypothetical protein
LVIAEAGFVCGKVGSFVMEIQLKPLGQQVLNHRAKLVLRRARRNCGVDDVAVRPAEGPSTRSLSTPNARVSSVSIASLSNV